MPDLTRLERAAAEALAQQSPTATVELLAQIRAARVIGREFTPFGFFTDFDLDRTLPPAPTLGWDGGWVRSLVGPHAYPLEFRLGVRDGYVDLIEAFSFGDGYGDIDLLTTGFTPPVEVKPRGG